MAKIKNSDIVEDGFLKPTIDSVNNLIEGLKTLEEQTKKNLEASKKFFQEQKSATNVKDIEKQAEQTKKLSENEQILNTIQKEKERLEVKLKTLRKDAMDDNEQLKILNQQQAKINKERAREQLNLISVYEKESKKLNDLRKKLKELILTEGEGAKSTKKLALEVKELDEKLKKVDAAAGQFQRSVGNYPKIFQNGASALKTFIGAFGITAGITGFVRLLSSSVAIFKDFEQANSKLQSVLGATREEMALLKEDAKQLGATTSFTASQVTDLQTEFAKLGFPTKDIRQMTKSTLDAAAAMGSSLGEQAALTGATLKAFQLDAKEAQRVNDVLAKSTTKSALDFSKLNASMSTIAPVANAMGFSLEDTISLLGNLSDSGFDASSSATATRNIMLKLADSSSDLGKRLKEPVKDLPSLVRGLKQLKEEGIDLSQALELTDARSVAAFSTFLNGTDSLVKLNDELKNAKNSAQEMADTMLDNLAGDITKTQSAWEGFILSLEDGEGILSKVMRKSVQAVNDLLAGLTRLAKSYKQNLKEDLKKDTDEFLELIKNSTQVRISNRTKEVEQEIAILESRRKRGVISEKQYTEERMKILNDFNKFKEEANKKTIQDEINTQQEILQNTTENSIFKGKSIDDVKSLMERYSSSLGTPKAIMQDATRIVTANERLIALRTELANIEEEANKIEEKTPVKKLEDDKKVKSKKIEQEKDHTADMLAINGQYFRELEIIELQKLNSGFLNQEEYDIRIIKIRRERLNEELRILEENLKDTTAKRQEILNFELQQQEKQKEALLKIEQERLDEEERMRKQQRENLIKHVNEMRNVALLFEDEMNDKLRERQRLLDEEMRKRERNIDFQRQLAAEGNEIAAQQVQFEEQKLKEAEIQKARTLKKEQQTKELIAMLNSYWAAFERFLGDPNVKPQQAAGKALAEVGKGVVTAQGVKLLVDAAFIDGTENVGESLGNKGKVLTGAVDNYLGLTRSGHAIAFDGNERIINPDDNTKLAGITNDELVNLGVDFKKGRLGYFITPQVRDKKDNTTVRLERKLDSVEQAIKNKPVQRIDVDGLGNMVERVYRDKHVDKITYVRRRGKI